MWIVYHPLSLNHELELLIKYETKLGDFYDLFFSFNFLLQWQKQQTINLGLEQFNGDG